MSFFSSVAPFWIHTWHFEVVCTSCDITKNCVENRILHNFEVIHFEANFVKKLRDDALPQLKTPLLFRLPCEDVHKFEKDSFLIFIKVVVQYSTVHYNTVHSRTVKFSTVKYTIVQYITVQYSNLHHCKLHYHKLHKSTLHYSPLQYSVLQYSTLQNITLY